MPINIREYTDADFKELDRCIIELTDFSVKADPLGLYCRHPDFSPTYTELVLQDVRKNDGVIFLAYDEDRAVGYIIGVVEESTEKARLESKVMRSGKILELYVADSHRGSGLGRQLMEAMERYLKEKKCTIIQVTEVLEANQSAHVFYKKLGYQDRFIDMVKLL